MNKSKPAKEALEYHSLPVPGKIEITPTKPCKTQQDLSLAYTPGVAVPCLEIKNDPENAYKYTSKGNLVAVLTNGTAVLGLGNIGAMAGKPVMEGKGVLFKCFADIDVFDIEVNTLDTDELIKTCRLLEPTFGGINLEDIKAPECFIVEEELKKTMNIPVFHDDQHGTAIIGGAALLNGIKIVGKKIENIKVVINGAGASGLAIAGLFISLGVNRKNLTVCDTKGVIYKGRREGMNKYKEKFAADTEKRTLAEAVEGCDVLFGLSSKGAFTEAMIKSMAKDPVIMAMANPDPEITPEEVKKIRKDALMATGRSDYPNQVNNVLCFPFMFRGALDVRATTINEEMKIAAAYAIAELAREEAPESVCRAYGVSKLEFGREYILPKPFDPRVFTRVSAAVAKAAMDSGVAAKPIKDFDEYKASLEERLNPAKYFFNTAVKKAKGGKAKIGFACGEKPSVLSAAAAFARTGAGESVLIGNTEKIEKTAKNISTDISGMTIIDPAKYKYSERLVKDYYEQYWRSGVTLESAEKELLSCPNRFGAALLEEGEIDGFVARAIGNYEKTAAAIADIIDLEEDYYTVSSSLLLAGKNRKLIISDPVLYDGEDPESLAEAVLQTAETAELLGMEPKVAVINNSNFSCPDTADGEDARCAVEIVKTQAPKLTVEGEMSLDTALDPEAALKYPLAEIKGDATVLVFSRSSAADAAAKCLITAGGYKKAALVIQGFELPVQIAGADTDTEDIVTLAAIAAASAGKKAKKKAK